jgi:exopolyphosphatase / guanosine-5'-triphosphate,3'-diphosphate pyrophosphatase
MVAIIDIGSNTIRLSVYDISSGGDIRQTYRQKSVAGLAGHVDKRNFLTEEGVRVACAALNRFRSSVSGMNITETHVFATASLRNVLNASRVIEEIKRETGFDVIIISGDEEAICDYIGANNRMPMSDGILIDIGGGSTELVICKSGHIDKAASIPIGALSMYTKYVSTVIPTKAQSEKIALETLKRLEVIKSKALHTMCGVGGTMRALYKLNNAIFEAPPDNRAVPVKNAKKILSLISTDTKLMVGRILQIAPERIHTITPGLIILNTIIKKYNCKTISISESGVREGYLIRNVLHRDIGKTGSPVTLNASGCKGS